MTPPRCFRTTLAAFLLCFSTAVLAQPGVTTPKQFFGFEMGADYSLANYKQISAYWQLLTKQSRRIKVVQIGVTEEGRPMWMCIVTSPRNHERLKEFQQIAQKLAKAEDIKEPEARKLAQTGKAVVWIDGGLHANETLGAQQLNETVFQLVSRNDPETLRILEDCIVLLVHANPDGNDLVADWYMKPPDPTKRTLAGLPRLYQKYIGHDNNRDFYAVTQKETQAMNQVMYREWFPQIVYNHHQTGPPGTVLFMPPFRDPFNFNFDPMVPAGIELVGASMLNRFLLEDKPGATTRSGARYSTWWNGGLRTTCYFHNMIGLLTETIGSPTPMQIPLVSRNQLPRADLLSPVPPQTWRFRQSVDYSITANYAVLDVASRHREQFLYNIYKMGRNSIEKGSRDSWTVTPKRIPGLKFSKTEPFLPLLGAERRDPRGYILSADQPDFPTAVKFINTLIQTGITVHRARREFSVHGKSYPAGSLVVKCAQAFRPHILDMFEPQDHPDDFAYPGAPPTPPYDSAGWTLAFQFGIKFDRILDPFEGPFERIDSVIRPPKGNFIAGEGQAGFLVNSEQNDLFVVVNRLLKQGVAVSRILAPVSVGGKEFAAGSLYIAPAAGVVDKLQKYAEELGVSFCGLLTAPKVATAPLKPVRIGLWDRYGGSIPSGWTRWLLEKFEFPFEVVYAPTLDAGSLRDRFDVLLLVNGAISSTSDEAASGEADSEYERNASLLQDEPSAQRGSITAAKTVPELGKFLQAGGTILTIGSSTGLARMLGLPVEEHIADSKGKRLPREKFYVPGSVLQTNVDVAHPLSFGMSLLTDVMFDNGPVFRLPDNQIGVRAVARYQGPEPLRSGWAWGQKLLEGGAAVVEARVGEGYLVLFGPEIAYRAQPHGTFKWLFNGIFRSCVP